MKKDREKQIHYEFFVIEENIKKNKRKIKALHEKLFEVIALKVNYLVIQEIKKEINLLSEEICSLKKARIALSEELSTINASKHNDKLKEKIRVKRKKQKNG